MRLKSAGSATGWLLGLALAASGTFATASHWTERQGTFSAYWAVSGTVHLIDFKDSGVTAAGSHTGTVTIQTSEGPVRAFETDCVAFADDESSHGRCVWTGPLGDLVYVELKGTGLAGFGRTRGTFVGGTGKYDGIEGGFSFEWNYNVSRGQDATFDGYTLEMQGNYRKP